MTELTRMLVFEFFLSVAVAWLVYGYVYKRVRLDVFREDLFTLRDDLFDYMRSHDLPYGTRAYGLLRSSINGMIRAADDGSFNLVTLTFYIGAVRPKLPEGADKVSAAIAAIQDRDAQKHFEDVFEKIAWIGLRQIWFEGPLSLALTPVLIVWLSRWDERKEEVVELGVELDRREDPRLAPAAA